MKWRIKKILLISDECRQAYPGVSVGLLVMKNVCNLQFHQALDDKKQELQNALTSQFNEYSRSDFKNIEIIKKYVDYYKRFKKNYHVLFQLESVALNKKSIPSVSTLVEAMFMGELKNFLLSAGHDLQDVNFPITLDISKGGETYTGINNKEQRLIANDLFIKDQNEIISSIIYGPDRRTRIQKNTQEVMYVVYALPGIEEHTVLNHLRDIKEYTCLFSPKADVEQMKVFKN